MAMFGMPRSVKLASAGRALESYLNILDGASDDERGASVYAAHIARLRCEIEGAAPTAVFLTPFALPARMIEDYLSAIIKVQKLAVTNGEAGFAGGLSVWVPTLNSVAFPELRVQGRRLWGMMSRGFASARVEAERLHSDSLSDGSALLMSELNVIPEGLEPRDDAGNQMFVGLPGSIAIGNRSAVLSEAKALRNVALRAAEAQWACTSSGSMPSLDERKKALEARLSTALSKVR